MKVLVNKMPTEPKNCLFATKVVTNGSWSYGCGMDASYCDTRNCYRCSKLITKEALSTDKIERQGKWHISLIKDSDSLHFKCSECNHCLRIKNGIKIIDSLINYCSNCGAKMEI